MCFLSYERIMKLIQIYIDTQTLVVFNNDKVMKSYSISTAKNGIGQLEGSGCTPLGQHKIAQKIGENAPIYSVFVGRVATGEIYDENLANHFPNRDWILTRILWLQGLEDGHNLGNNEQGICCDTFSRYIYIHGTPDTEPMGVPCSHGCIRMRNHELIELFDWVEVGTTVQIFEKNP